MHTKTYVKLEVFEYQQRQKLLAENLYTPMLYLFK